MQAQSRQKTHIPLYIEKNMALSNVNNTPFTAVYVIRRLQKQGEAGV